MNIIGIDVSKAKLDCAWFKEDNKVKTKVFTNQLEGWKELVSWAKTHGFLIKMSLTSGII